MHQNDVTTFIGFFGCFPSLLVLFALLALLVLSVLFMAAFFGMTTTLRIALLLKLSARPSRKMFVFVFMFPVISVFAPMYYLVVLGLEQV